MKSYRKLSTLSILMAALVFAANCSLFNTSSDDGDDQSLAAAALVLLGQGCTVGSTLFTAAGVTCSGGTATGTGTMIASATHTTDFTIQLNYQLNSGGSIYALSGLTTSTVDSNSGTGLLISTTAINGVRPTNSTGTASPLAAPGTAAGVVCLEVHYGESPDHILANAAVCPTGTVLASTVSFNSDTTTVAGTSDATGTNWGLILNNATITSITVNASKKFTE